MSATLLRSSPDDTERPNTGLKYTTADEIQFMRRLLNFRRYDLVVSYTRLVIAGRRWDPTVNVERVKIAALRAQCLAEAALAGTEPTPEMLRAI